MAQPSKIATGFLSLFGAGLILLGLAGLWAVFGPVPPGIVVNSAGAAALCLLLLVSGFGLIRAARRGYARAKAEADLQEANPASPWMWRPDWAERRANSENPGKAANAWFLCLFWNLISLPVGIMLVPQMLRAGDFRLLFVLIFPASGLGILVFAIRASLRDRRFGETYFEFDSLPFSPGSSVRGAIHLRFETDPSQDPQGIDLRLACIRRVVTGSGKSRSVMESVLWQTDKNIAAAALGVGPIGRTIPVDFALPSDVLVTDGDNPSDRVLWRLHAQAAIPGINYSDDFEIPVFRTSLSTGSETAQPNAQSGSVDAFGFPTVAVGASDSGAVAAPAQLKVVISPQTGGTEFYFPAFRTPARALGLLVFMLVWSGIVYFLWTKAAVPFAIVFGLFDLLLIAGLFHSLFSRVRILVNSSEISWRRDIFGVGRARSVPVGQVQSILAVAGSQQSGTRENVLYSIWLRTKDGQRFTLADEIDTRQEARWIVSQIESYAGLQLDTHVEIELPLGAPPQPGQLPIPVGRQNPTAVAVVAGFGIFLLLGMFLWQRSILRNSRGRISHAASRNAANPASSAPVPRRQFAAPLADADTARILAMPVQDQAEELLERAIEHDQKALELFTENVGAWTGHLHASPRLTSLEQRSRFSKDLRVRYANVDVNLALEGWAKSQVSVEKLIARAKPSSQYRSYGVYYLGMLAGRGVEYDRIHSLLLDYAQHDSDASVRQWAVEGLRFLGKDEVLDELFDSFTHDPSMSVRDRAGCNISDCGLFTRVQRIRMVPRLIDLIADPATVPQMRSWSFLALQEITDENLRPDVAAWSRWYAERGAEKLAQFQAADWWQIRGDE